MENKWKDLTEFPSLGRKIRILVCPANEGGCAQYRLIQPYSKLAQLYPNLVEIKFDYNPLGIDDKGVLRDPKDNENIHWADIVATNNIPNYGGKYLGRLCGLTKEAGKFFHYDTDDLLTELYTGHRLEGVYKERQLGEYTKFVYNNSDLITVTQHKFAERIQEYAGGVLAIVKNAIDYDLPCWNLKKTMMRNKVRVGWAGGIHHEEDVKEFAGIPHMVNGRVGRERIWWSFFGRPNIVPDVGPDWQQDVWKNYEATLMRGFKGNKNYGIYNALPIDRYGEFYAFMEIAIAPLQMNAFNDSKSDIKVAECGRYGVPLVASDVGCYSDTIINGKTGILIPPDAPKSEWVKALTKLAKNKDLREEMGRTLKEKTDKMFDLNKVVHMRLDLYEESMKLIKDRDEKQNNISN